MAVVAISDSILTDIADAIRSKNGQETLYKPSEMSDAIEAISGGGITPTGTKEITSNGTGIDVASYAYADVAVPNSYSAGDEGKVVSNGALVAQTSDTVTTNDTYDTTLINSLTVNVPSSGGGGFASGTVTPSERTLSITFDTGLSTVNGIVIVPTSETPLKSGGRTNWGFIGLNPGTTFTKSVVMCTNSAGSTLNVVNSSDSSSRFTQNGTEVTVTIAAVQGYFETISYTWFAW